MLLSSDKVMTLLATASIYTTSSKVDEQWYFVESLRVPVKGAESEGSKFVLPKKLCSLPSATYSLTQPV